MNSKKSQHIKPSKLLGTERIGLLVSTFGAQGELEDEIGALVRCHMRKNADPVITGDQVYWLPEKEGTASVLGHLPRKNILGRPENAHKLKLIAANLDALIIVTAPPPILAEDMLDRYLVAAENLQIPPIILLNKMDLLTGQQLAQLQERLSDYEKMGYSVMYASTKTRDGLAALEQFLAHKTCVLVGASGVGKSSITAALTQGQSIKIGEISAITSLGKHTTTTTRLYHLPSGGHLIDSPGVREFGLWHVSSAEILAGFIEFAPFLQRCKFRDCRHQSEPQCALKQAVADHKISPRRFQSYCKILREAKR